MLIPQMLNQLQTMANANRLNLTAEQVAMLNQQATFKKAKISFDENEQENHKVLPKQQKREYQ